MESTALLDSIDQLDGNVEALEELLLPLIQDSVSAATKKLPILDRAKLNTTVVYAIESLLFSYLKINGIDAKQHAVYQELRRVQSYFAKVKQAEESVLKPTLTLNKQAAARIIQHSLVGERGKMGLVSNSGKAGNGQPDMTQRERELKERIIAQRKKRSSLGATPVTPVPENSTPNGAADSMLESLAREIVEERAEEAEEAEGSEEGEIDETSIPAAPPIQHPLPVKPQFDTSPQFSGKKRKQHQNPPSKSPADRKADKRARKKAKRAQAGNETVVAG